MMLQNASNIRINIMCEMENLPKMVLVFIKNKRTVSKVVFAPKLIFLR